MTEKRIATLIISLTSLLIWSLLGSKNIIGGKTQTILIILSLIPFMYSTFRLLTDYKLESSYFKFIFSLFLCYEIIIVIRGLSFSYNDIKTFAQSGYIFWPYVIPLFIFFDKRITSFGWFFKWIYYSGVFALFLTLIFPSLLFRRLTAETYIGLLIPCGFLLLNANYLSNRKVNIAFFLIFISIISLTYLARRSGLISLLGFVISAYFLNIIYKSKAKLFRYFPLLIIIGVFILFSQHFEFSREALFNKMISRISEDTRSSLFQMFFYDLRDNMLFGKGMLGTYYFPIGGGSDLDEVFFAEETYRTLVENGYLQLLLTGGILHIVLFLLVLMPAAIKGIFMSSNQFAKASGVVILLQLLDMFFYGLPTLSLTYIFVWICVGVCYKPSIRRMTNDEIRSEFKKINLL
jgi:O-Antigen ligase